MEIVFVWNRTKAVLIDHHVPPSLVLNLLDSLVDLQVDLIIETAHPSITQKVCKQNHR